MDNTQRALDAVRRAATAINTVTQGVARSLGQQVTPVPQFTTVPEGVAAFNDQLGYFADAYSGFADAVETTMVPQLAGQPARITPPAALVGSLAEAEPLDEGPTGEALEAAVEAAQKEDTTPKRKGRKS